MSLKSLQDLYINELKDVYGAEKKILETLPKMAQVASNPELRQALEGHVSQTYEQVHRLETIFDQLGTSPKGSKSKGMEGIVDQGKDALDKDNNPDVRDAALIASAQRVKHYEMAAYGTLRTFARELGLDRQATLLQQTLDEESQTDKMLTDIGQRRVNPNAGT